MEPPRHCPETSTSIEICYPIDLKQDTLNGEMDPSKVESTNDVDQGQEIGRSKKVDQDETLRPLESTAHASSSEAPDAFDCATELKAHSNAEDKDPCAKATSFEDLRAAEPEGKAGVNNCGAANDCGSAGVAKTKENSCSGSVALQESSAQEHSSDNTKGSGKYISRIEDAGSIDDVEEHISDQSGKHPSNGYRFSEPELTIKEPEGTRKKSNIELDYDMVDPLEVARQVAIEVEREIDSREQSCSSSDKVPETESQQPNSPECAHETESQVLEDSSTEVATGLDLSAETCQLGEDPASSPDSLGAEPVNGMQQIECSQVTDAVEVPANTEKSLCILDLNQEVCSEDIDRPENPISTTISVVSASRAAAAPGLPVAPLQFEGSLGWKGSAATSAFRPASPRQMPEADQVHSIGSNSSSKQRDGCLDIDLNIDESEDDKTVDPVLAKQIPGSGLLSGESSVEVSPRRSERLELDLNRMSDDGFAPSDWQTGGQILHQRNGYHSQSPSSSSSSKLPSLRNIDLNDQPSLVNDCSDHPYLFKLSQNLDGPSVKKSDDSVISIMGMRVEVNRKDFVPQALPLLNGRNPETTIDTNLARSGGLLGIGSAVPYAHSPVYGYNGLTLVPALALPSGMYGPGGPIPYMLDSRGAPVIHQVVSSGAALPPAFSQPPFAMSVTSIPGSNGAGPSRNSFDLNSGLIVDGGNRENGGLRQFLNLGHTRSLDDQLKSNSQPSTSSGAGVKRKEPDCGWEPYPFKHHSPTWK